jgi:hypothetical protein
MQEVIGSSPLSSINEAPESVGKTMFFPVFSGVFSLVCGALACSLLRRWRRAFWPFVRRFLRRFRLDLHPPVVFDRSRKVSFSHQQVILRRNCGGVTQPRTDDMPGMRPLKLSLPTCSHRMKQLVPWRHASTPARRRIFRNCVLKLAFAQPPGRIAAAR